MTRVIVVKIGGSTLGSHDTTIADIVALQRRGWGIVVVHGGGKIITGWLDRMSVACEFVQGERVTDRASLEVVTAVLAGLVNKELVAAINLGGGRAVGISGVDGALVEARVKDPSLGYVGGTVRVNTGLLLALLGDGYVPVVAPVSLYSVDREVGAPLMLNANADAVAGEIALALGAERLVFLTDVAGVLDGSGGLVRQLSREDAESLVATGVAKGGMVPKIAAGLRALMAVPAAAIIDGRKPHALCKEVENGGTGTVITR
jgi:acetylglutamate kinase